MIKLYSKTNCSLAPVLSSLAGGANFYFGLFLDDWVPVDMVSCLEIYNKLKYNLLR